MNTFRTVIVGASAPDTIKLIEAINRSGREEIQLEGFVDDDARKHGSSFMGYPVLGETSLIASRYRDCHLVNNVARDMKRRESVVSRLNQLRPVKYLTLVHPNVDTNHCAIGEGSIIQEGVVLGGECSIGSHCVLYADCIVGHESIVGDFVFVANKAIVGARGSVGTGSFVGLGSIILPYINVGEWATIGAGSIVLRDVAASSAVFGNPARVGVQPVTLGAEAC